MTTSNEEEHEESEEEERYERMNQLHHERWRPSTPECCDAARDFMPVILCSELDGTKPRWYLHLRQDPDYFCLDEKGMPKKIPAPTCCPFCAKPLPKLVLKDPSPTPLCVTDGYHCNTCGERGGSCYCYPPWAIWGPEIGSMKDSMKCYPEHAENPVSIEVRKGLITHYYGPSGIVPFETKRNTLYLNRRGDVGCEMPGHAVGLGSDPEDRCGWRKLTPEVSQAYQTETGEAAVCWLCNYSLRKRPAHEAGDQPATETQPEGVEKTR